MQTTGKARRFGHGTLACLTWMGRHELGVLLYVLAFSGGLWAFIALADQVLEGDTHAIDTNILLAFRSADDLSDPLGPGWIEEMGRDFTALGGTAVLTLIAVLAIVYLLFSKHARLAAFTAVSVIGGLLISSLLKNAFDRPRPDLVPHESIVYTASFPSGHSMMAAVTYLTLAALLVRTQPRRRLKILLLSAAVLITVLVGISRVYLGVHWPSDVLAGWAAGAAWASLCWLGARWLQRRGRVEAEVEQADEPA